MDAGTTIRVGLQDLDVSGDPDETFDVYTDLIGATDTITASATRTDVMSVGTKTITHGDYVAIVMRMHARGGSDVVRVAYAYGLHADATMNMGLVGNLLGGSWASIVSSIASYINFDDGTQGFISGLPVTTGGGTVTYNVNTVVRDELGMFFRPPFACKTGGVALYNAYSAGSTFELCLYQNPLSATPTLLEAAPVDTALLLSNGNNLAIPFVTEHELLPANTYALTVRPTNTTDSVVAYYDMPTATAGLAEGLSADDWYAVSRVDNSGAFADWNNGVAKTRRMHLSLLITAIKASQT